MIVVTAGRNFRYLFTSKAKVSAGDVTRKLCVCKHCRSSVVVQSLRKYASNRGNVKLWNCDYWSFVHLCNLQRCLADDFCHPCEPTLRRRRGRCNHGDTFRSAIWLLSSEVYTSRSLV